jgi:hypothetical protein
MVAPPVIAVVALAGRPWHPVDDFAIIDLRVRDMWTAHPPLTGLFSRPGWNHPGPAMFWLIGLISAPFGQPTWATHIGGAVIEAGFMGWLAYATWRAGLRMMLAAAAVTGLTYLAIGAWVIRQPWNLHIPLIGFILVVFLAVLVATTSTRHLIGLAIAATIVVQIHVGFALPVATAIAFALVCVALDGWRARAAPDRWRSTLAITAGILAVLWLPPVLDVLLHWPGNLGTMAQYFAGGHYRHVGFSSAAGIVASEFRFLPPWLGGPDRLTAFTAFAVPSSTAWLAVPVVLLGLGGGAALRTARSVDRRAVALAAALFVAAFLAISRADEPRAYTFEWRVVVAAFLVVACVQAIVSWLPNTVAVRTVAAGVAVAVAAWGAIDLGVRVAQGGTAPLEARATALAVTLPRLDQVPPAQRVLVRPIGTTLRSLFDGVINELDRRDVDVRVDPELGRIFGTERESHPGAVDQVWYVTEQGSRVPALLAQPGARLVASTSPLTPAEDAELTRLQARLRAQLRKAGRADLVDELDQDLLPFIVSNVPGVDHAAAARAGALNARVARAGGCRCAIVAVPGGRTGAGG